MESTLDKMENLKFIMNRLIITMAMSIGFIIWTFTSTEYLVENFTQSFFQGLFIAQLVMFGMILCVFLYAMKVYSNNNSKLN